MSYTLSEIETAAKRAARGAGLPWGIAEEAAQAVRWLEGYGLPGVSAFAGLLPKLDGKDCRRLGPASLVQPWGGEGGPLCPCMTGAAMSDHRGLLAAGLDLGPTFAPILLLPFAARVGVVEVKWAGTRCIVSEQGVYAEGETLLAVDVRAVHCTPSAAMRLDDRPRGLIPHGDWAVLSDYGARTFAPDTETSRTSGAGAGLTDND